MNIIKYLKDENNKLIKVEWQVIPTSTDDPRGYELEGQIGKWLTIVSTFAEDAGKNILSINPYTNPGLENYEEITEEEYKEIQEQKRIEEEEQAKEQLRLQNIEDTKNLIAYYEKQIAKNSKILSAVKASVIYEGDLELMTALHGFTEDSIQKDKDYVEELKTKLEELEPTDGE